MRSILLGLVAVVTLTGTTASAQGLLSQLQARVEMANAVQDMLQPMPRVDYMYFKVGDKSFDTKKADEVLTRCKAMANQVVPDYVFDTHEHRVAAFYARVQGTQECAQTEFNELSAINVDNDGEFKGLHIRALISR